MKKHMLSCVVQEDMHFMTEEGYEVCIPVGTTVTVHDAYLRRGDDIPMVVLRFDDPDGDADEIEAELANILPHVDCTVLG